MTLIEEYSKQGNGEKQAENIHRLLFLKPDAIEARMKLIEVLIELKRYDEAGPETETVLKMDPTNAVAWNSLGVILLAKAQKKDAAKAFERALTLRPDYAEAEKNLTIASDASK
jgi:tetratricopeptide (TPR) repeat protein